MRRNQGVRKNLYFAAEILPLEPDTDNTGVGMVNSSIRLFLSARNLCAEIYLNLKNSSLADSCNSNESKMKLVKLPIVFTLAVFLATSHGVTSAKEQSLDTADNQDIETITVQGGYRATNIQQSPSSISVLTQDELTLRNGQNLEEIVGAVANVNFASGSQRARYYQIRGIGERSQYQEPINPSVGLMVDDIDFSGIGSIASTFDIAQVELYRGPQGTKFGASALAGLIYMSSNQATESLDRALRLSIANYDSYGIGGLISGAATDNINYRLSAEHYQSAGFIDNVYLAKHDTNNRDELSLRGKLAIDASEHLTVDLTVLHFNFDNGFDAFSLDNTRETLSDQPGFDQQETTAFSAKFSYSAQQAFDIIAIFSQANSDLAYGYDEDWSYVGLHPWEYSSTDHYLRDRNTSTLEFRLVSKLGQEIFNGSTTWVAGVYGKQDQEDLTRQYTYLTDDFLSDFDAQTLAAFAQFETTINQQLTLTTGLRVEQRASDYQNSNDLAFEPDDNMIGGKLVLSYQLDKNTMLYGSINRGYKAGSVNTSGSLPEELREFSPEYLVNVELGYKTSFLDDALYLRSAVFYMDRDDIQISSYHLDERADGSSEFISYWDNAAQGVNQGIELEAGWSMTETVELYGSLGLLDSDFSGYVYADGDIETGREQAHAPSYQFNLGMNYYPNDHWQINVAIDGKDEFYFSDSHQQQSSPTELLHGSISYLASHWQVKLWARNILDEQYATRGFYFGNDPRDGYSAKAYYQYGEPLVFGLTLDYQFD